MTRCPTLRLCLLGVVALCAASCGAGSRAAGHPTTGGPAAAATFTTPGGASVGGSSSAAQTSQAGGETGSGRPAGGPAGSGGPAGGPAGSGGGGNPGGPGPDPNGGGGGASQGGTRPGAPYDIEAFENKGASLDSFRASYTSDLGCRTPPHERCHVIEDVTGDETDPSTCVVTEIAYDPPSDPPVWPESGTPRPKIQEGTTVTATILCPGAPGYDEAIGNVPPGGSGSDGSSPPSDTTGDTGATSSSSPATDSTAGSASDSSSPST